MFKMSIIFLFHLMCFLSLGGAVRRNYSKTEKRMPGGTLADISQFPWSAAVLTKNQRDGYAVINSATIISENYLLTSGLNLGSLPAEALAVSVGSSDALSGGTVVGVAEVTIYPDSFIFEYDVAVLKVQGSLPLGDLVKPIPIADSEPNADEKVVIAAFGEMNLGDPAGKLNSAETTIIDRETCKQDAPVASESHLCASGEKLIIALYDMGGPVVSGDKLVALVEATVQNQKLLLTNLLNPNIRKFIKDITGI